MKEFKIPLRNNNKEIIDWTIVSEEDYELLNQYKWYKSYGYAQCSKLKSNMHRYIMIEILKIDINSTIKIDHIDNNRLNNIRNNLRIVTNSENARNKNKKEKCSSKYIGVSWDKNKKKWKSSININKKRLNAFYDNEYHSAHQYNLWCKEFHLNIEKINIIDESLLKDFILYKPKIKKGTYLPKYIQLTRYNTFVIIINNKRYGTFKILTEAIKIKDNILKEIEENKNKLLLSIQIKKNSDGECIIECFNNKKEKVVETIVDENLYHDLIKYKWYLSGNYIKNYKLGLLHRYIMNCNNKNLVVDHINNEPTDNRIENLRIVTLKQNNQNKSSSKNSSSKYIGVSYDKINNKWRASIKSKNLGLFINENDAAITRDNATKKYFGEFGNLNFK